jgi:LysR family transcriptional activator of nhaA
MVTPTCKHVRDFWRGGGGIAKTAEQPRPTPQSLAGQLTEFAGAPGVDLLLRLARRLEEPTETGKRMLRHAEDVFSAGQAWLEVVKGRAATSVAVFRVGGDSVSKALARRRAARPAALLADMAADKLDLNIADRPAPRAPDRCRGCAGACRVRMWSASLTAAICAQNDGCRVSPHAGMEQKQKSPRTEIRGLP